MKNILLFFSFLFLGIPFSAFTENSQRKSTLVVTYQSLPKGERLDRVKFWLQNERGKQTLFPKGNAYVDDKEKNARMVVIEDLTPGIYRLKFVIPNLDGRFKKIPEKEIKVTPGDVVKVTQKIRENTVLTKPDNTVDNNNQSGKLFVSYDVKPESITPSSISFYLIDSQGRKTRHPNLKKDTEIPLKNGKMVMISPLAEGTYSLAFFVTGDGKESIVESRPFEVYNGMTKSIHETIDVAMIESPSDEEIDQHQQLESSVD